MRSCVLYPWRRNILAQLDKKFPEFIEPDCSLPRLHTPTIGPYNEAI
jgi:hypothetical protein